MSLKGSSHEECAQFLVWSTANLILADGTSELANSEGQPLDDGSPADG